MSTVETTQRLAAHDRLKHEVIAQWYPRSIKDSNGDGVGDIPGMTEVLPELVRGFPVTAIWLTPMYVSPQKDNGYDVSDYRNFDPLFGTTDEFKTFVATAHGHGVKVIMDVVPNHVSNEHPWFKEALKNPDSEFRDYFIWQDQAPGGGPPNEARSNAGGTAWTQDEHSGQYYLHMFLPEQPDLNWENENVQREMIKVMTDMIDEWGVDGFRVDVADFIGKYKDEHGNLGTETDGEVKKDVDTAVGYLRKMADEICSKRGKFLMFETHLENDDERHKFYLSETGLAIPFNFDFIYKTNPQNTEIWGDAVAIREMVEGYLKTLKKGDVPIWVLGNHDESRVVSRLKGENQARIAAVLQYMLPGIPVTYYGEEIGMHDVKVPRDRITDKFTNQGEEDGAKIRDDFRTPYQRNGERNGGFSDVEPWLPVADDYKQINLQSELGEDQPGSMLTLYKRLRTLHTSDAVIHGDFKFIDYGEKAILGMRSSFENEEVITLVNFSDTDREIQLPSENARLYLSASGRQKYVDLSDRNILLAPNEAYVFTVNKAA